LSKMTDSLVDWILSFKSGSVWFNKLVAQETKQSYLPNLRDYCNFVKKNPDELISLKIEGLKNEHINTLIEFQAEDLLDNFLTQSQQKPSIKSHIRTTIISFYKHNRRPLVEIKDVETPEANKRCPSLQDILDLEKHFSYLRDKALLWFLASAPTRINTLTKLKWKDLKPTNDPLIPYYLIIGSDRLKGKGNGKYRGSKQVCFLHHLAAEKLADYKIELGQKGYVINDNSPLFIAYRKTSLEDYRREQKLKGITIEKEDPLINSLRKTKKIKALSSFTTEDHFSKASLAC